MPVEDNSKYEILNGQKETINKCFRCGLCRSVCPSFEEIGVESSSPRGRIQFAKSVLNGNSDIESIIKERMLDCLNCMKCAEICPADVRTDRVVVAARAELAKKGNIHPAKRLAFNTIIKSPFLMSLSARLGSFGQKNIYNSIEFLETAVPLLMKMRGKKFPTFSANQPLNKWPIINTPSSGKREMRVGYFVGCASNLIFTDVAYATMNVLLKNNIEVIVPKGQVCCGIPVYSSGDLNNAMKLAKMNLRIFDKLDIDCIVTDCASCSSALKHEINEIMGIDNFRVPVYDINEFIYNKINLNKNFGDLRLDITYHDPCHLRRGQKIFKEPREILKSVPGIDLIEMTDADKCCGGAGTFSFTHHDLSRKVGKRKIENIRKTGASIVATPCPSCRMQLDDLINWEGIGTKTIHPVEILNEAYCKGNKESSVNNGNKLCV